MKRLICFLFPLLMLFFHSVGQDITSAEYFVDQDPGQGFGSPAGFTGTEPINGTLNLNVSGIPVGFHILGLRVKNNKGVWGNCMYRYFYVYDTITYKYPQSTSTLISNAEYLIDSDLGQGLGTQVSIIPGSSVNKSLAINVSSLETGFHILMARVKNAAGLWSESLSTRFYIYDTTYTRITLPNPSQLKAAEYYFNEDLGQGHGTSIPVIPGGSLNVNHAIGLADMNTGFHRIGIRAQNENGLWSNAFNALFYVFDTTFIRIPPVNSTKLISAEYFFDSDEGQGSGIPALITAGDNINLQMPVSTFGIDPGFHRFGIRTMNEAGIWSNSKVSLFYIYDTTWYSLAKGSAIIAGEYYFDNDSLPSGQGNPLTLAESESLSFSAMIPVPNLSYGIHTLYVRVLNKDYKWSKPIKTKFNIAKWKITNNSPICFDYNDGVATVEIEQGSAPYFYLWTDDKRQTTGTAANLSPGKYKVVVTDANKFIFTDSVQIFQADSIQLDIVKNDAQCNVNDGFASVMVIGENPPYTYEWNNGINEPTASDLPAGVYYVTVTDNIGCKNNAFTSINDIGGPEILIRSIKDVKCPGANNGQINLMITGGIPPYTFKWSNGATTQDIFNLTAGAYEITVSDSNKCSVSRQFFITEPNPMLASVNVQKADCGIANGSATIMITGGTEPYTFAWQGGGVSATHNNLGLGLYKVYVSDSKNCNLTVNVGVGEKNAPVVQVTGIQQATCGMNNGEIIVSAGSRDSLYSFYWSNGTSNRDLIGVTPGTYSLIVTDTMNCRLILEASIPVEKPMVNPICLVTADSASKANEIVWSKISTTGIDHYNIYRGSSIYGKYVLIAKVSANNPGYYLDFLSDPSIKPYLYKISAVDTCGIESDPSPYHKTIHLTMNVGLFNAVNLNWNKYEGFDVNTYNVWRYTKTSGWLKLDNLSSDITSYTDLNAPLDASYVIEVEHPTGCYISDKKAKTLNSSRSNRTSRPTQAIMSNLTLETGIYGIEVFPNPNNGKFNLIVGSFTYNQILIKIFDATGSLKYLDEKYLEKGFNETHLDLENWAPGLYLIHGYDGKSQFEKRFVIE